MVYIYKYGLYLKGINSIYSTNTTHSNHSSIISSNNLINNAGNIFLNNLTNKNRQRNLQKKLEINTNMIFVLKKLFIIEKLYYKN